MKWLFTTLVAVNLGCGFSNIPESEYCVTPSGQDGECRNIDLCKPIKDYFNLKISTREDTDFLRKSHCGFEGSTPKVCCPSAERKCPTPEGRIGKCVGLYFCTHLNEKLTPNITAEDLTYINSSRCQGPLAFSVCCGPPPEPEIPPPPPVTVPLRMGGCSLTSEPPEINSGCCGTDGSSSRITGGSAAGIDQYPWLALVELRKMSWIRVVCGGSLISGRYVLTAAHCLTGPALSLGTPHSVRLGEYNTTNFGPDCAEVEGGGEDCTDGAARVRIQDYTPHARYDPAAGNRHDIALIRLAQLVPYTDFIRPICLPTSDIASRASSGLRLLAAGWGATDDQHSKSDVKMHVDLPYVDYQSCDARYKHRHGLRASQLCAGGEPGKDSCKGDSGGPLMQYAGSVARVVGVVSYGTKWCGISYPGVYTNVYHYLDWIRSNIKN